MIWHRSAEEDLAETYEYIGADSPSAAEQLVDAVEATVGFLIENPSAGRERGFRTEAARDVRSWPVRSFQDYLLFYRVEEDALVVVRIVHGARDLPVLFADEQQASGPRDAGGDAEA